MIRKRQAQIKKSFFNPQQSTSKQSKGTSDAKYEYVYAMHRKGQSWVGQLMMDYTTGFSNEKGLSVETFLECELAIK